MALLFAALSGHETRGEEARRCVSWLPAPPASLAITRRPACIDRGHEVIGLDNLNSYYDVSLKEARLARLKERERFRFIKADLGDRTMIEATFAEEKPSA